MRIRQMVLLAIGIGGRWTGLAEEREDPAARIAAQRDAMATLAFMDGIWRGPAWTLLPSGEKHAVTQTERIGPFLDGSIKVIEGRGYDADGRVGFNAFAAISYDIAAHTYTLHSYALGRVGDFVSRSAARSILVYSIYVFGLGATLLLVPNIPLPIFGLPQATEVWIRVAGMTVIFLSVFYFIAARNEVRDLFVASIGIRFAVPVHLRGRSSWPGSRRGT